MRCEFSFVLAAAVVGCVGGVLRAQFITPASATATSTFSGLYDIGNTIDGSGLPVGFTIDAAHANYTTNNHWTTQTNRTIGESASFTFDQPLTLGQFHFWNHRSNNIASNQFYEPVRYDLVFYSEPNGGGSTLANLTDLSAEPNRATGQTRVFDVVTGVRSVKFVIRATENNNISPFTGLAEVRFGPCLAPSFGQQGQPASRAACPSDTVSFVGQVTGSGPFQHQWQWRQDGQIEWTSVLEGDNGNSGSGPLFVAVGSQAPGMTAFPGQSGWTDSARYQFRVLVEGPCGNAESAPALLAIDPADLGSTGGASTPDGFYDNNDFIVFIDRFFNADPRADIGTVGGVFGTDGLFNNNDFVVFIDLFFEGC